MASRELKKMTPRQPTQVRGMATRQRILDAAFWILAHMGVSAVTIRRVAERAEVSVGSIYESFASLQAIHIALIEARGQATLSILDSVFNDASFKRPFRELMREYETRMREARLWSLGWVELLRTGSRHAGIKAAQTFYLRQHMSRYIRVWRAYGSKMSTPQLSTLAEYAVQLDIANYALQRDRSAASRGFYGDVTRELFVKLGEMSGATL